LQFLIPGTDGNIRMWDISGLPSKCPTNIKTISAHSKEVDYVDMSLDSKHVSNAIYIAIA